jgi:long-chain acyl-CoA synthetase
VYPREVEEILYAHTSIIEAAVISVPDDIQGEEVVVVIVTKENCHIDQDELDKFCRKHLVAYKIPRKILVMDTLPKGPTGKIMKRLIKEQLQ